MTDDDLMDRWIRDALAAEAPRLSSGFDAAVMAGVQPRRLTTARRTALAAYGVGALAVSAWTLREAGVALIAASTLAGVLAAVGLSTYAQVAALLGREP